MRTGKLSDGERLIWAAVFADAWRTWRQRSSTDPDWSARRAARESARTAWMAIQAVRYAAETGLDSEEALDIGRPAFGMMLEMAGGG